MEEDNIQCFFITATWPVNILTKSLDDLESGCKELNHPHTIYGFSSLKQKTIYGLSLWHCLT